MAGPEAYPPTPITTSGWNSESILRAAITAPGNPRNVFNRSGQAHAIQSTDFNQTQRESRRRDQAVLDSTRRANEQQFRAVTLLEFLRDGQRRNHMSAGPTSCQYGTHAVTITEWGSDCRAWHDRTAQPGPSPGCFSIHSACLLTFSSTPTQASVTNNDDPP